MSSQRLHTPRRGFTMVELILVMAIMTVIGIFSAMMIPNIQDSAKITQTRATMRLLEIALEQYRSDIGHFPRGTYAVMTASLSTPGSGWKRASMEEWFPDREDLNDAWGMPFHYLNHLEYDTPEAGNTVGSGVERVPGMKDFYMPDMYQLYSTGPNMRTWPADTAGGLGHPRLGGTEEDDIRNWKHGAFRTPADY